MRRRSSAIRSQIGFTLVEVVLALSIFALMGTILYGAFSLGHGAVDRSRSSFAENQRTRALGDLLGQYIRSSFPYRTSPQDPSIYYAGEETQLSFISAVSQAMGGRGMARIHLSWDEDGALKVEEEAPVRLDAEGKGGFRTSVTLLARVKNFRLAYLDPQSDQELWTDRWDGKERRILPRAVRFTYSTEEGREVRWIFPVMISTLSP